jgi:hypothetical protein
VQVFSGKFGMAPDGVWVNLKSESCIQLEITD